MMRRILIFGGLLLIATALCITAYILWDEQRAGQATQQTLEQMAQVQPDSQPPGTDGEHAVTPQPESPGYLLDPEMEMPTVDINGTAYIGTLEIPALELTLPVISQWSDQALKLAPCRYTGSAYLNDLIIAGHNYKRHFARLNALNLGDDVLFTDIDGHLFSYQVSKLEQLAGTAVEEMEAGEWDLTLFTCTIGGKARMTVRCERQNDTDYGEVR